MDKDAFELAKNKILRDDRFRHGIGTLSEKTLHAILKLYYGPDTDMHEVPIENYVADIYNGERIIEIQTHDLGRLRGKLEAYLKEYMVTVVYPIPRESKLIWLNAETGEKERSRKSPHKGNVYEAFIELYRIIGFLKNPNLEIRILLLDISSHTIESRINEFLIDSTEIKLGKYFLFLFCRNQNITNDTSLLVFYYI